MSALAIVVLVLVALLVVLSIGGLIVARRHAAATEDRMSERIAVADQALEAARAADRGWDPLVLEEAARVALQEALPDFHYDRLQLVLVDDRPGTDHDRAEMIAASGTGLVRIAVTRHGNVWAAKIVG